MVWILNMNQHLFKKKEKRKNILVSLKIEQTVGNLICSVCEDKENRRNSQHD